MERTVEGTHISFLRYITGNRAHINTDGTWVISTDEEVLKEAGIKTASIYIIHRQVRSEKWVDLIPIFKICVWDPGL